MGQLPGPAQHVQGVELQAVEVVLDRAPGVNGDEVAEAIGELGVRPEVPRALPVASRTRGASGGNASEYIQIPVSCGKSIREYNMHGVTA